MEDFHLVPEIAEVGQLHIEQVQSLEESESKRLLRRYREVRQELRDRLATLPRGTFSAQQLRGTLLQVELAIKEMTESLKRGMESSVSTMSDQAFYHLSDELNIWNKEFTGAVVPINLDAAVIASDTSNLLLARHNSSLDAYGAATYSSIAGALTQSVIAQDSMSEVMDRLSQHFIGKEWELQRLARTELHNVYGLGKIRSMTAIKEESMPDLMKTLMHPMDHRTGKDSQYAATLKLIVPIDEPFVYKWGKETREFMAPPDRPNDRSILIPYREAWGNIRSKFAPQRF